MKYFCVYDANGKVTTVYYDRESMGDLVGVAVDLLPTPDQNGLEPVLKIDFDNNTLYYDYVMRPPALIDNLLNENTLLKAQVKAHSERSDFIEDVISELATQLYK